MSIEKNVRVRFAPSPTGHLHIGGLRTALFNWLFARHHGGAFLLRIEDTDYERSTQEYRDSILHSFAWTQLEHDEEIITQSERIAEHQKVAEQLIKEGKAYRCFCSPEEVVARYGKATDGDAFVMYDGHCRNPAPLSAHPDPSASSGVNARLPSEAFGEGRVEGHGDPSKEKQDSDPHVIRFKLPKNRQEVTFDDLIKGTITFNLDQLDDFIIVRSGGFPMYNFVVVVDDAFMHITHIIRGEEHIVNTPKQILLYEACGYDVPQFAHLPLILGPSGDKLSKRDGATSVVEYRREGYIPHALLNYLARLGWSHGDQEIFSLSELIEHFSLDKVGKNGAIFDFEKLAWVNSVYLKAMTEEHIIDAIIADVDTNFMTDACLTRTTDEVKQVIALYKERVKTLKQMAEEIDIVFNGPRQVNQEDMHKWISTDSRQHLEAVISAFEKHVEFTHDTCAATAQEVVAQLGIKLVTLLQPIRLALLGKASGPGVFDLLAIIGKEDAIGRLKSFCNGL